MGTNEEKKRNKREKFSLSKKHFFSNFSLESLNDTILSSLNPNHSCSHVDLKVGSAMFGLASRTTPAAISIGGHCWWFVVLKISDLVRIWLFWCFGSSTASLVGWLLEVVAWFWVKEVFVSPARVLVVVRCSDDDFGVVSVH
jgi:hypothetical protein